MKRLVLSLVTFIALAAVNSAQAGTMREADGLDLSFTSICSKVPDSDTLNIADSLRDYFEESYRSNSMSKSAPAERQDKSEPPAELEKEGLSGVSAPPVPAGISVVALAEHSQQVQVGDSISTRFVSIEALFAPDPAVTSLFRPPRNQAIQHA